MAAERGEEQTAQEKARAIERKKGEKVHLWEKSRGREALLNAVKITGI